MQLRPHHQKAACAATPWPDVCTAFAVIELDDTPLCAVHARALAARILDLVEQSEVDALSDDADWMDE